MPYALITYTVPVTGTTTFGVQFEDVVSVNLRSGLAFGNMRPIVVDPNDGQYQKPTPARGLVGFQVGLTQDNVRRIMNQIINQLTNIGALAANSATFFTVDPPDPPDPVQVVLSPTVPMAPLVTQSLSASVLNTAFTGVAWSVLDDSGGSITSKGKYTAPAVTGTYRVQVTTTAAPFAAAVALISVQNLPVVVNVFPSTFVMQTGTQQKFVEQVLNTPVTGVTWSVSGATAPSGTVNANGRYTAPNVTGTFYVVATSVANGVTTGSAQVTVTA